MTNKELTNEYMNLLLNMSGTFKLLSEKSTEFTHLEQHIVEYINHIQKKTSILLNSYNNL
ncbi:hypothetical protein J7E43_18745 [Bacillus sp. ISL-8]|uniref:Uncharacterized protein n=1 Tax=Bacillus mycoides TaxID=1405 RepID=A0A1W6A841_BACMY|nr:hypothetical protein B7492_12870 [Bacillus mycoides]MBT2579406.1 hypothetical protein [Bacillus sp. ISL-8]TKI84093.1 hypothetical protein FC701_15225 [Bacillus mycoides]